jgi:VWFA-related protein
MNARQRISRPGRLRAERFLAAFLFSLGLAVPAARAQQTPPSTTLKVTTEVVNVLAIVKDKHGRLIPDLNKDDFEITEDNVPQKITYFSRETNTPLTMAMLIDTSPSQIHMLPFEQEEAKQFLRTILRPKDLVALLHFDLDVGMLQDLTNDRSRLDGAIDRTQINGGGMGPLPGTFPGQNVGGTHLYDAIDLAANRVLRDQIGRKVMILLTDGQDEGSAETLNSSLEAAQKADVMIYSLAAIDRSFYGGQMMGFNGDSVLQKLSEQTGGAMVRASREKDLAVAFQEIARELRTQYLLGYTPTNSAHDGTYRHIRVKVRDKHDKVQARRGYYAPRD